ncbi:hypothetical protein [Leptospira sarikeiensis]|uniref:Uncharacterized protein n=1 Tax=Leptospira sarikeiensis TaxID=2484943 RepID=A0A4R9JZA4_9LEPT|nr:hypothetical protein [Leptospira sarikeiensis]TGL58719.1 hypothetical protein EHQ64_16845 [Leptospira sarikeiensis]
MKLLLLILLLASHSIFADDDYRRQIFKAVNELRKIEEKSSNKELDKNNALMDENWALFKKNKSDSIRILKNILDEEIKKEKPSSLVILDLSWFLVLEDKNKNEYLPQLIKYYERIDFRSKIISFSSQQFFNFSLFLSEKQQPDFLKLIDERFLRHETGTFFIPQHMTSVSNHAQRTHLYGVYGNQSIKHLLNILESEKTITNRQSILSILRRICTSDCAIPISNLLEKEKDHESFVSGTYILLDNAGPIGKELYLKLSTGALSAKTKDYFDSEKEFAKNLTYEYLMNQIEQKFGKSNNQFNDKELLSETEKMINNAGSSTTLHPSDFINSTKDKEILIGKLLEARRKSFLRVNRHGLDDIDITNMVINTLNFKP